MKRLLTHMRFECMSFGFLGCVVPCCPIANKAGLVPLIMRRTCIRRTSIYELSRGAGEDIYAVFNTNIPLEDIAGRDINAYVMPTFWSEDTAGPGINSFVCQPFGVFGGIPVMPTICRQKHEELEVSDACIHLELPPVKQCGEEVDMARGGLAVDYTV